MVDYEKVDKFVENCKKLYPDIPDYCLWVLACDYYINEEKYDDDNGVNVKKEALESYEKAKEELKTTQYENIQILS